MKIYTIWVATLLFAASCTPPRVVTRLVPEAPEGHFEQGREYILLNNDGLEVELGFDGMYGEHMVFDLVVYNHASDTLALSPLDFYYEIIDHPSADSSMLPPRMAIHPDRILYHYQQQLEKGENQKEINTLLGFIDAGIGLVANTTAFIATDDPGYIADAVLQTLGAADYYVTNDRIIGDELEAVRKEKEIVEEELFRQVHLPPGKVASGYVYFPRSDEQGYLMFCFPAGDQLFQFVYHQQKSVVYQ
jgi:hypothetical protein